MKFLKTYIGLNFLTWTGVALFDLSGDYFNEMLWDREFNWREEIPFVTAWYTWFLLTPVAVFFARKWEYAKTPIARFIVLHFAIYIMLNIIQIFLATFYMNKVSEWLLSAQPFRGILYKNAMSGTFYNFLVYGIIVLVVNSVKYYKDLQQEQSKSFQLENKLVESRMQFLKQQLQPHFLFNTHHSIITLMKIGEKAKAIEMMEKLSDLMRFGLRETAQQEVTLAKEIHLLEQYLGIQKIRFQDKLSVEINIETTVADAFVPAMILQPIVENSIKYAVENSSSESQITIDADAVNGRLCLVIKDQGSSSVTPFKKGIGISNTEERLKGLYGKDHYFSIKSNADAHGGTEVVIKIPLRYA
ncbi:MAG TPA: histidine kinase [Chitinophagaceae bacterium]|nr:histidine kinase [Chitinophagaceae bacterium]